MNNVDILIIGGGHAGVEAAQIASQFSNLSIAILSLPNVGLASAPCNPAIGGVGKGQVVRELDVLGGIIGKLADLSGIQFRTLNDSKGYAVQSTRVQIDKDIYSENAEKLIADIDNIKVIKEKVIGIEKSKGGFVVTTESSTWNTKKLITTVGTFLNGKMHTGQEQSIGGRIGCDSSSSLGEFFKDIKTISARFKTGTPSRLNKNTIDYSVLVEQPSDNNVRNFHCFSEFSQRTIEQVSCYLAHTNEETMTIIRENKERSPMFNGKINGVGARYCPSIEDKAFRYPDKNIHHVFIEPEGLSINTVYPSGVSSSLPRDVQKQFIQSIKGLEKAEIEIYGYAVEYDVIDTTLLSHCLEHKEIPGLFFAGQINGTSGYEEAAAQGFIAGVNAALDVNGQDDFILDRNTSYIGVMIEDLISNTRDEPYRLFTARNENRLYSREDNSVVRMYPHRESLFLSEPVDRYNKMFVSIYDNLTDLLEENYLSPNDPFLKNVNYKLPRRMNVSEFLKQADIDPVKMFRLYLSHLDLKVPFEVSDCVAISSKYSGYIDKANKHYEKVRKLDDLKLNWKDICNSNNISFECKSRIEVIKPITFGQLKLIEGIRPATLAVVAGQSL